MSSLISQTDIKEFLVWRDNIGYLPGSSIKFSLNDRNELVLYENSESLRKRQKSIKDFIFNDRNVDCSATICSRCFKSEFKENLVKNSKYCKDCSSIDPHLLKLYKQWNVVSHSDNSVQKIENAPQNHVKTCSFQNFVHYINFDWDEYLKQNNYEIVPYDLFFPDQSFPDGKNEFQVGMKIEGVDPFHPSRFSVLTVVEIQGFRLKLHFDGYDSRFDFMVNANSKFIFPANFCRNSGRKLESVPGIDFFVWDNYISLAAPENCFKVAREDLDRKNEILKYGFKINRKLEAVDRANSSLICVATIKDILDDNVLIHFDGWDDTFDYWTPVTSNLIHPVDWCKFKGKQLTPPKDYLNAFCWVDYLKKTNSQPVPESAFTLAHKKIKKSQTFIQWKTGMKLEAVDKFNPYLIRVATVAARNQYLIKIHFDGWDEKYDLVFDDDSPDLHPVGWCSKANIPLMPPPNPYFAKLSTLCPIPSCNGIGHVLWYKHKKHNNEKDCPYSNENIKNVNEYLDRYEDLKKTHQLNNDFNDKKHQNFLNDNTNETLLDKIDPYYLKIFKENYLEMKSLFKSNNFQILKSSTDFFEHLSQSPVDFLNNDCNKLAQIIEKLTNDKETAHIFRQEKITGLTFLALKHEDLKSLSLNNKKIRFPIKFCYSIQIIALLFVVLKFLFHD